MLPPNKYRYIDGRTNFSVCDPIEARSTYEKYSRMYANRYNRRKYVDGAMYCGLFKNCAQIIEPIPGGKISLSIKIGDSNEISTVIIYCDIKITHKYLLATNKLGKVLNEFPGNTSRSTKFDNGKMYILGKGKLGNGTVGCYNLTHRTEEIQGCVNTVASFAKNYYSDLGLIKEVDCIAQG